MKQFKIVTAFDKMLRGHVVEISKELRSTVRGDEIGMNYYITAINDDQTVNLKGIFNGWEFKSVNLNHLEI
jgi:hypothetical protein